MENFHLWELLVKAVLQGSLLVDVLILESVNKAATQKAFSIVIFALGDGLLQSMKEFMTAYSAWKKLSQRYEKISIIDKLSALSNLLNYKYKMGTYISNHVAQLGSNFPCLWSWSPCLKKP